MNEFLNVCICMYLRLGKYMCVIVCVYEYMLCLSVGVWMSLCLVMCTCMSMNV